VFTDQRSRSQEYNSLLYVKDFQGNVLKFFYYKSLAINFTKYSQGVEVPFLTETHLTQLSWRCHYHKNNKKSQINWIPSVSELKSPSARKRNSMSFFMITMTAKIRANL